MNLKRLFLTFILFWITLASTYFFRARFLPADFFYVLRFVLIIIMTIYAFPMIFLKNKKGFVLPLQIILVAAVFSIFMALYSWNQSFLDSVYSFSPYMFLLIFFYLQRLKISIKTVEKMIIIFGIIYLLLFFYQLQNTQEVLFGYDDEFNDYRFGIVRVVFPATGFFLLMFFYALSMFSYKRNVFWFAILTIGSIAIVVQVIRQTIVSVFMIMIFHFIRKTDKVVIKTLFFGLVFIVAIQMIDFDSQLIKGLQTKTEANIKEGKNYTRIISAGYFLTEFSPNLLSQIFGNGVPRYAKSEYGKYYEKINYYNLDYSDVGIIGVYAMFGFLGVFGYILIFYKSFSIKLPPRYYYLQYYLWYLLLTSLTSFSVYHYYYLGATMIVLYNYQYLIDNKIIKA